MSALIGRFLLGIGIGVVTAVVYAFINERNRERHVHGQGRPGALYDDTDYPSRPSWGGRRDCPDDDDDDDAPSSNRHRPVKKKLKNENETKQDEKDTVDTGSLIKSCPICLDTFQDLKRKGIPIYSTPCGHLFCFKCLSQSVVTSRACPNCRVGVSMSNCHRIYL